MGAWQYCGERRVPAAAESTTIAVGGPVVWTRGVQPKSSQSWSFLTSVYTKIQLRVLKLTHTKKNFFLGLSPPHIRGYLSYTAQAPQIVLSVCVIWVQRIAPFFLFFFIKKVKSVWIPQMMTTSPRVWCRCQMIGLLIGGDDKKKKKKKRGL